MSEEEKAQELYERAHRLTDAIMQKFGELHLNAIMQPPTQGFTFSRIDTRTEIWQVIACFLGTDNEEEYEEEPSKDN